jgi:hypothetical protein
MRPNLDLKSNTSEDKLLQKLLPLFSSDVTLINRYIGFVNRDGFVYYFNGQMPLFRHEPNDLDSFKMFMAQLHVNGNVKQAEINRTFNLNPINMKRWTKKYIEGGAGSFYRNGNGGSGNSGKPRVLTESVIEKVQSLFDQGYSPSEVGVQLGLKADTLRKAIKSGKLHRRDRDRVELKKTMILV